MRLVHSGSPERPPYLCTACGARFNFRHRQLDPITREDMGLEDHWDRASECRTALNDPIGSYGAPPWTDRK